MHAGDIAIVGMSCQFAGAANLAEYWANLASGRDLVTEVPEHRWRSYRCMDRSPGDPSYLRCHRGGYLPQPFQFDAARYGVMPRQVIEGDPDHFFLIQLMDAALADAGIGADDPVRAKTDVFVGRGGYITATGLETVLRIELTDILLELLERKFPEAVRGRRKAMQDYLLSVMPSDDAEIVSTSVPNLAASRAANRLNLRGAAEVVDAACASSLVAVELAIDRLRNGRSDLALVSGIFLSQSPTFYAVFDRLGALSPTGRIRPFDEDADGLLVGEGGGSVVLKRWEDADAAGDEVYAIIKGTGVSSDGRQGDVLAPSVSGQVLAYERAYANAGVDPATIGSLEAHGTATLAGDAAEVESIRQFFGTSRHRPAQRIVGSVKSMIGHTMPASGMASLIKTALSLSSKVLIPSLHCSRPHPDLATAAFYVNDRTRPWIHDPRRGKRRAGVSSFGFGGINVHVVMEEVTAARPARTTVGARPRPIDSGVRPPTELLLIGGSTLQELLERLDSLLQDLRATTTPDQWSKLAVRRLRDQSVDVPYRLSVIAASKDIAIERLDAAKRILTDSAGSNPLPPDVAYSSPADRRPGRVACILPGMGFPGMIGQYPRHLMDLCLHLPKVREQFDVFEDRDRHPDDPYPTSYIFCPPVNSPAEHQSQLKRRLAPPQSGKENERLIQAQATPESRFLAGLAVTLANWAAWVMLQEFEIPVDMVTGQSQGELAAVCAAGSADFLETAPTYWQAVDGDIPEIDGQMAFAWIDQARADALLKDFPDLEIAIHISPEALILGGPREALYKACEQLQQERVLAQLLPYPPIHTSAMSSFRAPLVRAFDSDEIRVGPPRLPLYSSITADLYPSDRDGIRDHLLANLDRPLKIWQTLRAMTRDGARIFFQLGAGHMASQLSNLLEPGSDAVGISTEVDTVDALTQLQHVLAFAWTQGINVNFKPLTAQRDRLSTGALVDLGKPVQRVPMRIEWSPLHHPLVPPAAPVRDALPRPSTHTVSAPPPQRPQVPDESGLPDKCLATQEQLIRETGLPLLGMLTEYEPGRRLVMWRTSDLDVDLYLMDHEFANARPYKPHEQCYPVAPLTFSLEALAEAAAFLCPGLGLIGYEDARALRMLGLMNRRRDACRMELTVDASASTADVVRVQGRIYARNEVAVSVTIVLGAAYPVPPADRIPSPTPPTPWNWDAMQIYRERFAFHGPRLQCIKRLKARTNPLFSAELEVLPHDDLFAGTPQPRLLSDPVVLDGVLQVLGVWSYSVGQYSLPFEIRQLQFFTPRPAIGSRLEVRVQLKEFNTALRRLTVDLEVIDDAGEVWCRGDGCTDWMFAWPLRFSDFLRQPERIPLSDPVELVALSGQTHLRVLRSAPLTNVDPDWLQMILLHPHESLLSPQEADRTTRLHDLLQRLTLKEAILAAAQVHDPDLALHPASIELGRDDFGRWIVLSGLPDCHTWHLAVRQEQDLIMAVAARSLVDVRMMPRLSGNEDASFEAAGRDAAEQLLEQPVFLKVVLEEPETIAHQSADDQHVVLTELIHLGQWDVLVSTESRLELLPA